MMPNIMTILSADVGNNSQYSHTVNTHTYNEHTLSKKKKKEAANVQTYQLIKCYLKCKTLNIASPQSWN